MLVENQWVETSWNPNTRKWYEDKGYVFTKYRDKFMVKAEDLTRSSGKRINVLCDCCEKECNVITANYYRYKDNDENNLYYCHKCSHVKTAKSLKKTANEVKKIVESKNNNKLLNPEEYVNVNTKNLKVICGLCEKMFITSLASIMESDGSCSLCGIKKTLEHNKLNKEEVEYRINSVNNNILLNPEDYLDNSTINLKIRCGECGDIFITSLRNYEYDNKIRCNFCSRRIRSLERIGIFMFSKYKINYIYNHRFEDCRDRYPLLFDFYLPDYNMCIEFDGQHHFEPKWGEKRFKKTLLHDGMKNNYCRWNNIKLLRIPYWESRNIEYILIEELNIGIKRANEFKHMVYKLQSKQTQQKIA